MDGIQWIPLRRHRGFSQWNLCLLPSIKVNSSCLMKYFQTVWLLFSLLLCRNTVEGRAEMRAKCSHTLSKWAIWHYTPLNTPNGRQRKPLFVIFGRQTKSKFMDRKWSKKCIYEPFWSSENGFWPYLLYLRRCICQAQIHSRYQLPSAPILLFSKQTLLHFETKKKPHTFKRNLVYSSISCSCSRCRTNIPFAHISGGIIFVFFVSQIPIFLPAPLSAHNFFTIYNFLTISTLSTKCKKT